MCNLSLLLRKALSTLKPYLARYKFQKVCHKLLLFGRRKLQLIKYGTVYKNSYKCLVPGRFDSSQARPGPKVPIFEPGDARQTQSKCQQN